MSIIKRFFLSFYNIDPSDRRIFGKIGEEFAEKELSILDKPIFVNKIIPHPKNPSRYIESDIIVLYGKSVFCIEVKRVKGKVFLTNSGMICESHRAFERRYRGYRVKKMKDPIKQSEFFTKSLKRFLIRKDSRFKTINFIWIVAFSKEADISSIHSFDSGVIYISELPDFINKHIRKDEEPKWVVDAIESLKGFDSIINRNGLYITGFIKNNVFECLTKTGVFKLPYSQISSIKIEKGGLFSHCDTVSIIMKNKEEKNVCCMDGYVLIDVFGSIQKHFLKNVEEVSVRSL